MPYQVYVGQHRSFPQSYDSSVLFCSAFLFPHLMSSTSSLPLSLPFSPADPSGYRSCEEACTRNTPHSYYPECKSTAGDKTDAMTGVPADDAAANTKTWCECVEACMTCVSQHGGTGERPNADVASSYDAAAFGICAPPPANWNPADPAASTNPTDTTARDTEYICVQSAGSQTCDMPERIWGIFTTCKPGCVDCLVAAAQHKCTLDLVDPGASSACPEISNSYVLEGQCIGSDNPQTSFSSPGSFSSDSAAVMAMRASLDQLFQFTVRSSPFEWTGTCQAGQVIMRCLILGGVYNIWMPSLYYIWYLDPDIVEPKYKQKTYGMSYRSRTLTA
jgi:hypothetical protein